MAEPLSPVDIARIALRKLTELKLPPTPENYAQHYRDIAGMPPREEVSKQQAAAQALEMARALLEALTSANRGMTQGIEQFDLQARALLVEAERNEDPEVLREVFAAMTASSTWLLTQVEDARAELARTREQLDIVHRQLAEAQSESLTDVLTGLANRRAVTQFLAREMARATRQKLSLCVALIDLDHFKRINDQFGHLVGDRALCHFAQLARPVLRETDVIGRWGGEEFLAVLPDTPIDGAVTTVSRIRKIIDGKPLVENHQNIPIGFSVGVARFVSGESADHLVERADRAMYVAKQAGRGRTAVADEGTPGAEQVSAASPAR